MEIPEEYKKLKFYNWNNIYYYNNKLCSKVDNIIEDEIIDEIGDRFGKFIIYKNGYIKAETICGNFNLKVNG